MYVQEQLLDTPRKSEKRSALRDEAAQLELDYVTMQQTTLDNLHNAAEESLHEKEDAIDILQLHAQDTLASIPPKLMKQSYVSVPYASKSDRLQATADAAQRLADFDDLLSVLSEEPYPIDHSEDDLMYVFSNPQPTRAMDGSNNKFMQDLQLPEVDGGTDLLEHQDRINEDLDNLRFSLLKTSSYLKDLKTKREEVITTDPRCFGSPYTVTEQFPFNSACTQINLSH